MILDVSVDSLPQLAAPRGAHELAWWYLLDAVFADASHVGVGRLHVSIPHHVLTDEVEIRAQTFLQPTAAARRGMACLGSAREIPGDVDRLYTLEFGWMAPRVIRRSRTPLSPLSGWRADSQLCAYTWKAALWGVPIRWADLRRRPDLVDRALFAMRRDFVADRDPTAYYRLVTWSRT